MRILFINNDGGGFADYLDVAADATVQQLFQDQVRYGKPGDYLIRVNRQPATGGQPLAEGDRVSITPLKIEGAQSSRMSPSTQIGGNIPCVPSPGRTSHEVSQANGADPRRHCPR